MWVEHHAVLCRDFYERAITKESIQEAFGILETSIESALKKFSDTVLHNAECVTRTICFKAGTESVSTVNMLRKNVTLDDP